VLFLRLQRLMLRGSLAGGRGIGGALIARRTGLATVKTDDGWTRAATAGYRPMDNRSYRRKVRDEVFLRTEALDKYRKKHPPP
jgi:hypothetical protein